jgi:flagellar biosynthesis protein FlhB
MSEKTEEPTPRRLRKALEEGDSGASSAFAQSLGFVVAIVLAPVTFGALGTWAGQSIRALAGRPLTGAGVSVAENLAPSLAAAVVGSAAPLLLAVGLTNGVFLVVQTGGAIATKRLAPRFERLDPIRGFRGLFSRARAVSVLRSLVAAAAVSLLAFRELRTHAVDLVHLTRRPELTGPTAQTLALAIARWAIVVGLVLGAFDLLSTRRGWRKRLRMSKDEVKRELKESEGDPHIRAARQRAHQEMLAAASALSVKNASVVIVNPTHLACALRYDAESGDEAPVVVASGEGYVAQQIVRAARDYGVQIIENVSLARALRELEIGDSIPEALYETVAEVLREILDQADG